MVNQFLACDPSKYLMVIFGLGIWLSALNLWLNMTFFGLPFVFMYPCLTTFWTLLDESPEVQTRSLEELTHFLGRLCTTCIGGGYISYYSYDFIDSNYNYKAVFDKLVESGMNFSFSFNWAYLIARWFYVTFLLE